MVRIYLLYLRKLLLHKWYVFKAGRKLRVGLWQLIVHDLSKFRPSEFIPYARFWDGGERIGEPKAEYERAWGLHTLRNPHHWQHWLLIKEGGEIVPLEMPIKYVREMIADWSGAQRIYQGGWNPRAWYMARREKILLHYKTRNLVQALLNQFPRYM